MRELDRITFNSEILGGKACIRGMRMPLSLVLRFLAGGTSRQEILEAYPYLDDEDISPCLEYAAELAEEWSAVPVHMRAQGAAAEQVGR